jgi:uncharacterized protein YciI
MKIVVISLCLLLTSWDLFSQSESPLYDSVLAKSLGSDDYGMKSYILVMLKTGPVEIKDEAKLDSLFTGHMENIVQLANLGKLIVAGPFSQNEKSYRGIFILNVRTFEEASTLLNSDPFIKAKVLEPELFEWYGSAALGEYLKVHARIEKKHF